MAHINRCLRRFLRSSRRLLFAHPHARSATHFSKLIEFDLMQNLHYDSSSTASHGALSSSSRSSNFHVRRSGYHVACLPLHGSQCFSPAVASSLTACLTDAEKEDVLQYSYGSQNVEQGHEQLIRTHSCSKIQSRMLIPSLKSLLHRSHSQGHLFGRHSQHWRSSTGQHGAAAEANAAAPERFHSNNGSPASALYTGSCSSPNLLVRRHRKKGACSFHGNPDPQCSCSKGKRVPKGHVAVYVDEGMERHVVPIHCLSHTYFQDLLRRAENEYGYGQKGGLVLPCTLAELHQTLHLILQSP